MNGCDDPLALRRMAPFGRALLDFFNGDGAATVIERRDDGLVSGLTVAPFFQGPSELPVRERVALDLCRGRVLDIGAGAGRHALALQARGLVVCAIDVLPEAVAIMAQRGVKDAREGDIFAFTDGPFDTLLLLGCGIGLVENLDGLDRFLMRARGLLRSGGQVLLDSLDVRGTTDPIHRAYQELNRRAGRYIGEIGLQFEYREERGLPFHWLHVDPETLADHAKTAGWCYQTISQEMGGDYLARLTIQPRSDDAA